MTKQIKLPPLPLSRCGYYTGSDVLEYARAAIEADRQARGEPVCFASINKQGDVTRTSKKRDGWAKTPLYSAPQPQQTPEGYKQTLKEFFVALDAAMDLDKSCSTYSSKPKGTLTERVTAWGEVNRLRAMLAKYGSHQIQEGYKLVPIEPTEAMLFACEDAGSISNHRRGKRIYKAMLEAAPEPKEKP